MSVQPSVAFRSKAWLLRGLKQAQRAGRVERDVLPPLFSEAEHAVDFVNGAARRANSRAQSEFVVVQLLRGAKP